MLGTTATFATGFGAGSDDSGYNTTSYPNAGTDNKTEGVQFAISTVGYQDIVLTFDLRHSNTSANTEVIQYSTDGGTTFVDFQTFTVPAGDTWYSRTVNFNSIAALNNNANAVLGVVSAFDPTTGNYKASTSTSTYGTSGTWRFDNVTLVGNTFTTTPTNNAPTDLALTSTTVNENVAVGSAIATFTTTDSDTGNTHTYTLVSGTGDSDNSAFIIDGNTLKINTSPDFETKSSYNIRVRTTDQGGLSYEEAVTININDVNEVNNATPTIQEATATTFLNLAATGSGTVSGVINDPTDPAKTLGIDFAIADADTLVDNLTVTVTSSNQSVVANANLTLSGTDASRNLKINPTGVGFADITVTVSDGNSTNSYTINYAASAGW
ncbi:MAG: cadherin repeat domain-containing protein [Heteroscytonema crispum UTEX LB 1556]